MREVSRERQHNSPENIRARARQRQFERRALALLLENEPKIHKWWTELPQAHAHTDFNVYKCPECDDLLYIGQDYDLTPEQEELKNVKWAIFHYYQLCKPFKAGD